MVLVTSIPWLYAGLSFDSRATDISEKLLYGLTSIAPESRTGAQEVRVVRKMKFRSWFIEHYKNVGREVIISLSL